MIDQALLQAYADGECSEADSARVEAALETDADAVARLEALMGLRGRLREAFEPVLSEPVADRTVELIRSRLSVAASPGAVLPPSNIAVFKPRARPAAANQRWAWPAAMAACLAAGVLGGVQISGPSTALVALSDGQPTAGAELAQILDLAPSGESRADGAAKVKVMLSFAAADGAACRQFSRTQGREAMLGLACKEGRRWRMRAMAAQTASGSGDYQTVSGAGDDLVSQMADRMIVGQAFDADQERRQIAAGWVRNGTPAR
jgi:hypothetical protein